MMNEQYQLVRNPEVISTLATQLLKTNRNPADLLAIPEYADNKTLLLEIAIESFLQQLSSDDTRKYYRETIQHFAGYLHNTREASLIDAIGWDIASWREDLAETGGLKGLAPYQESRRRPNTPASVETKTSALSSFYAYLAKPGFYNNNLALVKHNPVDSLPKRHSVQKYGKSQKIGIGAFKAILKAIDLNTVKGMRDFALLYGYYITGRRHTEWSNLQWKAIDWTTSKPSYCYTGKGGKNFRDAIPAKLLQVLDAYLTARWGADYKKTLDPETYLFTSLSPQHQDNNTPLVESSVLRIIKGYAEHAELSQPEKTIIHSLRHLHAEAYLQAGANVEMVRGRLQHEQLDTTQIYASTMDNEKNPLADKLLGSFQAVPEKREPN